ncbi:MAG TPA: sigma factor-like helix-turn-helix DNA-binding protein, partial [Isosphaeraceae bacterium]|nr:sigma factor-like helix-turn-helix DNA-binding protein [Isosphaeraceae bacterium]
HRTGLNARATEARRRAVERVSATTAAGAVQSGSHDRAVEADEQGRLLHQEIMRLPEWFRAAVVLCDLEGLSYLEAAQRLNLPLGTLQSRLARARQRLRDRLSRQAAFAPAFARGLDLTTRSEIVVAFRVAPPLAVVRRTCCSARVWAAGGAGLGTIVSNNVQWLINEGTRSMLISQLKPAALILTTAVILSGVAFLQNQTSAHPRRDDPRPSPQSQAVTPPSPRSPLSSKAKALVIPAPRELKAAAGSGKALLYDLDRDGNRLDREGHRIPDRPADARNPAKEINLEMRWAVVTGIVDHRATQASFSDGGRFAPPPMAQIYRRVELERQIQVGAGAWSDWRPVDPEPNFQILDNMPEEDAERTPPEVRLDALVDPLPHLTDGFWSGVDVERFVPNRRETKTDTPRGLLLETKADASPQIGLMIGQVQQIHRTEPPLLMLRQFDFTVVAGQTYRYRARVVVNHAGRRTDVAGAMSEPTNPVSVR